MDLGRAVPLCTFCAAALQACGEYGRVEDTGSAEDHAQTFKSSEIHECTATASPGETEHLEDTGNSGEVLAQSLAIRGDLCREHGYPSQAHPMLRPMALLGVPTASH